MQLAIFGAGGRMGQTLARLCSEAADLRIVGAVDAPDSPFLGRDLGELVGVGVMGVEISADLSSALLGADVLIDFSIAAAFDRMLRAAMHQGLAVVSGTTRLSPQSEALMVKAQAKIPLLWAPNMSVAVHVLARLAREAIATLGADYDVEVVETHHNRKADAPSGTASFLVQAAQQARPELTPTHGREGEVGARKRDEIGVHALRGGGVVGDHCVHLIGEFDRLEIGHRAMSRELFAQGALRAARWIVGKAPGRYGMAQVIEGPSVIEERSVIEQP